MNIIICGAGRVGFTIAKQLSEQGHSITVIDPSSEDIQKIDDALDVKAIVGKGSYPSILEKANAQEADMIIAVTRNDEINMVICQIAFSIFKIPKKIARIRSQDYLNPKFTTVYNKENLPIDVIISPEIEIAKSIQRKLEAPGALDSVPFAENKIRLLEILINENCSLINIKLSDLTKKYPNLKANVIGIIREDRFFIPKKSDEINLVSVIMGSKSDWTTMQDTCDILDDLKISYETKIVSAHRTPNRLFNYAKKAKSRGISVIIAGAGGAAHLPGMIASLTTLPVLGVPIESKSLKGIDSLLSILQMPAGIPVGTLAIGSAGAKNAALLAASILSSQNTKISKNLEKWRLKQTKSVAISPIDD